MVAFSNVGPVWVVTLDEPEVQSLAELLKPGGVIALAAAAAPIPGVAVVVGAIAAAIPYVLLIDKAGGNHGVEITGVAGTTGVIVTPRGVSGIYGKLIEAARVEVVVRIIIEFLIKASAEIPALGALGFASVGVALSQVLGGVPLVAALVTAWRLFGQTPELNDFGHVEANRDRIGPWESFVMAQLGAGTQVSLLSWQGLFSAQGGGGGGVYANRPQVGPWERWNLIDNQDGSFSFQTDNGHYLCAEGGGGTFCVADRKAIGSWERFIIEHLPDGRIALKTWENKKYVSIQPRQS
jgi:hypothetical protein